MEPLFIVYDLGNISNIEKFIELAKKEGYYNQRDNFSPGSNTINGIFFSKDKNMNTGHYEGVIDDETGSPLLYVFTEEDGKPKSLDDVARSFKSE